LCYNHYMPLPQQVVEQLSRESSRTPGWSSGIILFSGTVFGVVLLVYLGLTFGYTPYLNAQISQANDQIKKLDQSVSADDQTKLATFYSQVTNLHLLTANHIFFSQFLSWLEDNTEANVYYTNLTFTSGNQISFSGVAKTQADLNQQMAIFESSGNVASISVSNLSLVAGSNAWTFSAILTLKPSLFLWQSNGTTASVPPIAPTATTSAATSTP